MIYLTVSAMHNKYHVLTYVITTYVLSGKFTHSKCKTSLPFHDSKCPIIQLFLMRATWPFKIVIAWGWFCLTAFCKNTRLCGILRNYSIYRRQYQSTPYMFMHIHIYILVKTICAASGNFNPFNYHEQMQTSLHI